MNLRQNSIPELIWKGNLSVEVHQKENPLSYLANLPRQSYFAQILEDLKQLFAPTVSLEECWLSSGKASIKWHWPVGVLYDLLSHEDPDTTTSAPVLWHLEFHVGSFPSSLIVPMDSMDTFRSCFFNALKESDYVRNGSSSLVIALSKQETDSYWNSLLNHDFYDYRPIATKLFVSKSRIIPLKFYLGEDAPIVQTSASLGYTLGQVLQKHIPEFFPSDVTCSLLKPVLQGIVLPLTISTDLMNRDFCYPDGFLHIVLIPVSN
ncbi:autophagy associated protein Atg5 [Schizosaccharomyces cryophilus OY26]|uniref:Autophagy protein 5 n=1 Tax=Schizosaccharomyces cryophilus (strain OY26 / ATCC MYA-4695 / CBS 11777 / NBRC 106824 / NRRL Y48691) TaxID=653667 RepID=S9VRA2_SCHCR|nr:autophagy associated protein Atg5 [Schizosaccharomyces cryophilus OY26]EPY50473.1 autophagy associated protein Atg5 [Schizosaccharomyces cryophilus OY26]